MDVAALRRSLAATLAYFDLFEHPLTLAELLRHRYRPPEEPVGTIVTPADALVALGDPAFATEGGFWFPAGRRDTVATRLRRARLADRKFARALRVTWWLRLLPSVRMVAVCNSLALENADHESDIDLFVVARPGTLWATRLLSVSVLALLGLRPSSRTHADKVCMSFFVSEARMNLADCAIAPDDVYLRYWLATLVPLYESGETHARFVAANAWARDRVPGYRAAELHPSRAVADAPRWTAAFAAPLRLLDAPARALQRRLFPAEIRDLANRDTRVMVTDDMLKFHVTDRREEFRTRFNERLWAHDEAVVLAATEAREPALA